MASGKKVYTLGPATLCTCVYVNKNIKFKIATDGALYDTNYWQNAYARNLET